MTVRHMKLKLEGDMIGSGRIPLNVLQKVLTGIQMALYHIGEYHHVKTVTRHRGPFPKEVINQCTLDLVAMGEGSFTANLELPSHGQMDMFDLGEKTLRTFINFLDSLADNDDEIFSQIRDRHTLQKVLRTVGDILPKSDDYSLIISSGAKRLQPLTFKTSSHISRLFQEKTIDQRDLIGKMIEVRVVEAHHFQIQTKKRQIKCHFTEDLVEEVVQSLGKEVMISGEVLIDEHGQISSVSSVSNIQRMEPGWLTLNKITWDNRTFELSESLSAKLDIEDGLWTLANDDLGILVFEDTTEAVFRSFQEEFAFLWDEYAQEDEDMLTSDALELKNKMIKMVEKVREE